MKKKKLVFILNNFLIGGTERVLLEIIKNLDRNRFEINIITVFGSGPIEIEFRKLGIPILFAGPKKYPSFLLFKAIWILSIPFILLRLMVFLRKIKPDIVITSLYEADILGIFSAWLLGIKKRIIIYHDVHKMSILKCFFRQIFSLNLTHKIIAVSSSVKEFLINYWKIEGSKIIVIPNGVNFQRFKLGKKTLEANLVLGFIGRFVSEKNPQCLLKSLVILKRKYRMEPKTIMVGGGKLESNLKQFVSDNNLNNIQFVGMVNNIMDWLKKIDILVISSSEEGLGLVVLEGLASHKIIIASNIDSIRELITTGYNGILFTSGDSNYLAEKLKDLLINRSLVEKYQSNVNEWIKENRHDYDIKESTIKYEKEFL